MDCVRDAARAARPARSQFGAPLRGGRPVVTITIIAVTVLSYLAQLTVGEAWTSAIWFWPAGGEAEPWRFLTTALAHYPRGTFGIMHILFNMYALWAMGQYLEPALGRLRFAVVYVLSTFGGSVMVLLLASPTERAWYTGVVGASGAVFGLFGAIAVVLRRLGSSTRPILTIVAINGLIGFLVPGIAWQGHLGGLLTGAAIGAAFAYAPRARRREVGFAASVGIAALLVVLALLKYASV